MALLTRLFVGAQACIQLAFCLSRVIAGVVHGDESHLFGEG